jgi:hypothetical protein
MAKRTAALLALFLSWGVPLATAQTVARPILTMDPAEMDIDAGDVAVASLTALAGVSCDPSVPPPIGTNVFANHTGAFAGPLQWRLYPKDVDLDWKYGGRRGGTDNWTMRETIDVLVITEPGDGGTISIRWTVTGRDSGGSSPQCAADGFMMESTSTLQRIRVHAASGGALQPTESALPSWVLLPLGMLLGGLVVFLFMVRQRPP